MASPQPQLLQLAEQVQGLTRNIVSHLERESHPEPTFSPSAGGVPESKEYDSMRTSLKEAANDLIRLVNGPKNLTRSLVSTLYDLAALQIALEYKVFSAIPLNHSISLSELSKAVGMDEDRLGRIVRLLATHRIFIEPEAGVFGHTATSALLAKDSEVNAGAHMQMDEVFKAASESSASIQAAPHRSVSSNSAFVTRHGLPMFEFYEQNPTKAARFAQGMGGLSAMDRQLSELRDKYPWSALGKGKVVDVGGGSGHVSVYLARQFADLEFVVQDVSRDMMSQSLTQATSDIQGRVTFMQHSFFEPQPIRDAGAFFIRQCLHNWNDQDGVIILRAIVPALEKCRPGTPLLINETIVPEVNTKKRFEEQYLRQLDIAMLLIFGGKQRTLSEFRDILRQADERFEIVKIHGDSSIMSLIEVHLKIVEMDDARGIGKGNHLGVPKL